MFGFYLQLPVLTNAQNVPMLIETNLENAARSTLLELTKRTQRRVACARAMGGGEPAAAALCVGGEWADDQGGAQALSGSEPHGLALPEGQASRAGGQRQREGWPGRFEDGAGRQAVG